ncbi:MAG TPA: pyruvate dehydrogenase complex dihydrolipoamide acetyltransferase [Rhizobiaceae bacterium]|nr:pyruvate dehydrogenase complex dihydrolipoamide acetyltransferase [Rhizobiaceae bacterium]
MPVEVILPKVDMDMATGQISRWFVTDGQSVKQGDVLFEIETDKAAMEIDAPASGTVRNISGKEGVDIPVGQPVAWIYAEGEAYGSVKAAPSTSPLRGEAAPLGAGGGGDKAPSVPPTPAVSPPTLPTSGEGGSGKARATPLARRLARENRLEIAALNGSGPHGRVTRADIMAAIAQPSTSPLRGEVAPQGADAVDKAQGSALHPTSALRAAPSPEGEGDAVLKLFEQGSYDLVPHDNMRKTIARRLVEAKSTIPHFYLTLDCELDALLALRKQLNDAAPVKKTDKGEAPVYKLSVNDMIIKAMAMALMAVPDANASWTESAMVKHKHADVGVAVSIPGGLITPIIRKAETKTLSAISNEMKDLAGRARNRKLKPEEYQGGTTAVSNLGMFGIKDFAAVINPPHATILAVGAGEERAVVKKGEIKIATIMSVTLSTDHRAVDGALGAELLTAFKRYIETPMGMLV